MLAQRGRDGRVNVQDCRRRYPDTQILRYSDAQILGYSVLISSIRYALLLLVSIFILGLSQTQIRSFSCGAFKSEVLRQLTTHNSQLTTHSSAHN